MRVVTRKEESGIYSEKMEIDEFMWCPKCNKFENVKATVNINSNISFDRDEFQTGFTSMYFHLKCVACENLMVLIEKEIFNSIIMLNEKGYITSHSCEGHSFDETAYIMFDKTVSKIITGHNPPNGWYYDIMFVTDGNENWIEPVSILRPLYFLVDKKYFEIKGISFEEVNKKAISSLESFVEKLPGIALYKKSKV